MPALLSWLIDPMRDQCHALLPPLDDHHLLGCHRPRIRHRLVFDKLMQILVLGTAYYRNIDPTCSAITLRRRHDARMRMAWVRKVCGRLKSNHRYSKDIVYINFPWPENVSEAKREAIARLAQAVLDARAQFPDATLADLYDPLTMPPALAKAHEALDRAVDRLYRSEPFESASERVALHFERYNALAL